MRKMKFFAGAAFFLNTLCFATYYAVAKEALGRIDPIMFTYFEMMTLAPVSVIILLCSWRHITRAVVRRGLLLGSTLCLALFTIAIALNYTSATSVAFFPALNGFLAGVFAWLVLRQPMRKTTWLAGLLSLAGVVLLAFNSSMGGWRGPLIAFLGGLFFTGYVFVSDMGAKQSGQEGKQGDHTHWPLFGIELLTMAVWANLVVLLFGDWHTIHPSLPKDIYVIAYVAGVCTFLPTLIAVLMQRYISPVTVSFIYILEPVLGALISTLYLGESLPLAGYAGGLLIVLGAIIHTWASARVTQTREIEEIDETRVIVEPGIEYYEEYDLLPDWESARSPLQRGLVTYSVARKGEKQLLQQRRQQRISRLRLVG
ncbi:MAG TPA: DMT family transporter [Ktedonobacteraceae bacterium]|nr:DMT family transporter [Ktedonobacteraceae bacterium]